MLEPNTSAPDFRLATDDDRILCLKDLAGHWAVLYFYPKDNTAGCTTEALEFSERMPEFEALKVAVVGISPDSVASHKKFKEKKGLSVKLLSDPDRTVLQAYGAWGTKKMYGKETTGVIRSSVLIDAKGIVRKVWPKVKSAGHAGEVLETVRRMLSSGE